MNDGGNSLGYGMGLGGGNNMGYNNGSSGMGNSNMMGDVGGGMMNGMGGNENDCHVYQIAYGKLPSHNNAYNLILSHL